MYPLVESSLTEAQHGFMKHISFTTQLLDMYHMIGSVLDALMWYTLTSAKRSIM